MWVVERLITLPDNHHAHHGLGKFQNFSGNYGQLFFIWDVLFGTAQFPHHRQQRFGLNNDTLDPWYVQLYYPLIKASNPKSRWAK